MAKEFGMGLVRVEDLREVYRVDQERIIALSHINPAVASGEICCILGTSGSGKSTLLNIMAGLGRPSEGRVVVDDVEVAVPSEKDLAPFQQKNIGFVSQSYNLMPTLSAIENVAMPLVFRGISEDQRDREAVKMLHTVRLGSRLLHRPTQMSGGQQQRVSIARTFVARLKIMLAGEPTGNLDNKITKEVMETMVGMMREHQETLILVTHGQDIARYMGRIATIMDGNI